MKKLLRKILFWLMDIKSIEREDIINKCSIRRNYIVDSSVPTTKRNADIETLESTKVISELLKIDDRLKISSSDLAESLNRVSNIAIDTSVSLLNLIDTFRNQESRTKIKELAEEKLENQNIYKELSDKISKQINDAIKRECQHGGILYNRFKK